MPGLSLAQELADVEVVESGAVPWEQDVPEAVRIRADARMRPHGVDEPGRRQEHRQAVVAHELVERIITHAAPCERSPQEESQ